MMESEIYSIKTPHHIPRPSSFSARFSLHIFHIHLSSQQDLSNQGFPTKCIFYTANKRTAVCRTHTRCTIRQEVPHTGSFFSKWLSSVMQIQTRSHHTAMCCSELWKPKAWAQRASHTAAPGCTNMDSNPKPHPQRRQGNSTAHQEDEVCPRRKPRYSCLPRACVSPCMLQTAPACCVLAATSSRVPTFQKCPLLAGSIQAGFEKQSAARCSYNIFATCLHSAFGFIAEPKLEALQIHTKLCAICAFLHHPLLAEQSPACSSVPR